MKRFSVKVIVLLLVLALFALMAMGTGGGSKTTDEGVQAPSSVETSGEDTEKKNTSSTSASATKEPEPAKPAVTVDEAVLVDEKGVKITVTGLDTDDIFGQELKLLIENNSGKAVTVQARSSSVNGYMVDTLMSADVADGKKANDGLTFMSSDMEKCGITEIADCEFSFHIFDSETWDTYFDTDLIQIKTSAANSYKYSYNDSGDVVYDNGGIKIVIKGLVEDSSYLGPGVRAYIYNGTDKNITVQTRDVSVNGFMVSAIFSSEVTPGKHCIDDIDFMSSDLEDNGITEIEDCELSFHIFDSDSWNTIDESDAVKINFK